MARLVLLSTEELLILSYLAMWPACTNWAATEVSVTHRYRLYHYVLRTHSSMGIAGIPGKRGLAGYAMPA